MKLKISRVKQITSPGWMHETTTQGWCTGKTQRDGMGREEGGGLGCGICVNPWLIHVNVWQKPLQYCKVISLQLIKINGKKEIKDKEIKDIQINSNSIRQRNKIYSNQKEVKLSFYAYDMIPNMKTLKQLELINLTRYQDTTLAFKNLIHFCTATRKCQKEKGFFFFIYFYQLEANYFIILQWFLPYIDMNQPWIYVYSPEGSGGEGGGKRKVLKLASKIESK